MSAETILLHPRPLAQRPGALLLLPLLPKRKPLKPLPSEIWTEILTHVLASEGQITSWAWSFLTVCKSLHDVALPLLYSDVRIFHISALEQFHCRLYTADQKWDSIRRIPFSTPGRWVQSIDLSGLHYVEQTQALLLDSLLTTLFPLVPFLAYFTINPSFVLSRRAISSLASREGAVNLRSLEGLSYVPPISPIPDEDPFVKLLRCCPNLETLEIIGQGLDPVELEFNFEAMDIPVMDSFSPIYLLNLRVLTLLSMHTSPLMLALLYSPLPSLEKLKITPYDDIPHPASLVSTFISIHGAKLRSLLLFTPKSWPTRLHPSPHSLLQSSPNLHHLSLEKPLPALSVADTHPLVILSIPRPNIEFWRVLEGLFPRLPHLTVVRTRDVRWLRKGMTSMAQEAGVQGELKEWRRRLSRRGIRVLDADWNDYEP